MAPLSGHRGSKIVKLIYLGDSGVGKTGSLVSLVEAGYKLKILDVDNGLNILRAFIKKQCPERMGQVDYETRRDRYKATTSGPVVDGIPKCFSQCAALLTKWSDGSDPSQWGEDTVFVLDSFTHISNAALEWAKALNPGAKDQRSWYRVGQNALENILSLLTSEAFNTNVIVTAHVQLIESADGGTKGYVNSIGKALGPVVPTYFNTMVLARSRGEGTNVKRSILTVPTAMLDLKNPKPFEVKDVLPLETGLATLFTTLKETEDD